MGCTPSREKQPSPPPEMKEVTPDSPSKRKRAATPEPELSESSDTPPTFSLAPASPQKKSRHSSNNSLLSTASIMAPSTPLTPPDSKPGLLAGASKNPFETASSLTPPDSQTQMPGGSSTLGRAGSVDPPSPTPNRRGVDVDALSITLGSFSLSDSAASAPEVVESTSASSSSVPPGPYYLRTGPYRGRTVDELPKEYRKEISDNEAFLAASPGLQDALIAWAGEFEFQFGRHEDKLLADVPLYYLNEFILGKNIHRKPGNEDLYVALKWHALVRRPEQPGQNYVMTFGKHCDDPLDAIHGSYISWMKGQGIPCQEGYEDLAEAIEYQAREDLVAFLRAYPEAPSYTMPGDFQGYNGVLLASLSEQDMHDLGLERNRGPHTRRAWDGEYIYSGMVDAVAYWWHVFDTNRWNWRRERFVDTGEVLCYPPDLERRGLLYPRSTIAEEVYVGYSRR
ncbi:hypothetical protein K458DRAFT_117379 [Lentithecium fluviatile CBS 122367]|uniref:Uncharacterized protein n=1 Tax=Lentithecium fluviatile CBS 122367 TaxID=1168545 RepID=A0A6G1INR7_9PLEO|nr:hypothetical protein K458DRAFT_117379 [Lentithecium fluviatile CBS 122367]